MLSDFCIKVTGQVLSDSTAALGIAHRKGLGRTRHIRVQYLWIQEKVDKKEIQLGKVHTHKNIADLMTKHLKTEDWSRLMAEMGLNITPGRAEASLALNSVAESARRKLTRGQLWKLECQSGM